MLRFLHKASRLWQKAKGKSACGSVATCTPCQAQNAGAWTTRQLLGLCGTDHEADHAVLQDSQQHLHRAEHLAPRACAVTRRGMPRCHRRLEALQAARRCGRCPRARMRASVRGAGLQLTSHFMLVRRPAHGWTCPCWRFIRTRLWLLRCAHGIAGGGTWAQRSCCGGPLS